MITIKNIDTNQITISWDELPSGGPYRILWSDRKRESSTFISLGETTSNEFTLKKSSHRPYYVKVTNGQEETPLLETPVYYSPHPQIETLDRGLIALSTDEGIFLSWRLLVPEVSGFDSSHNSLITSVFQLYKNGSLLAEIHDSTNYLDQTGLITDSYQVKSLEGTLCEAVCPEQTPYFEIPLQKPSGGVTKAGESYDYQANDLSVIDIDGDGQYEFILKWDPTNSRDVSQRGYTGNCYLDCYKMNGQLIWRLDCGQNIRAGAHYTQFICYDFDGDGKGEMALKTAPGSKMQFFDAQGILTHERFITLPEADRKKGVSHKDDYVCSGTDYATHIKELFLQWHNHPEVLAGHWPQTLEACFDIPDQYTYPLTEESAMTLTNYFLDSYAPSRSEKNRLREFEGFIYEGPEYLTMFAGDGQELATIPFPIPREDDGLLWGDYAWNRIEPCNRVDRFLSGVAYLNGETPSLLICRGYYTRAAVVALDFLGGCFQEIWRTDSGFVPMNNPFHDTAHNQDGTNPFYGALACQGDHSLSCADVDGDGKMEVIYGGATLDHDGTILYSSKDLLPNGHLVKLNHGDAMHVADIDPNRPGLEIFNVFEEASAAPYGYALRRAEDGTVIFGEYEDERDLGRCMVGDITSEPGLQCWVNTVGTFDCQGKRLNAETLGTNFPIRFSPDFSTQVLDGVDYLNSESTGVVNDWRHGVILTPMDTATNNGTKGNPCLVADLFGDYREELVLRTKDNTALRIYSNTQVSQKKLPTLMQDPQYRCGIAWQNNCYNQPCYPSYYYASDMQLADVFPEQKRKPVFYLAGDSTVQTYTQEKRPQFGWGEFLAASLYPDYQQEKINLTNILESTPSPWRYENQKIIVDNRGAAGRSTKTYQEEKRFAEILNELRSGDWLFLQFGHNDCNQEKPERWSSPADFIENLKAQLTIALAKQATPVLLTPILLNPVALATDEHLTLIAEELEKYREAILYLAHQEQVLVIDVWQQAKWRFAEMSNEAPTGYYLPDNVHLNEKGARFYAEIVAQAIRQTGRFGSH